MAIRYSPQHHLCGAGTLTYRFEVGCRQVLVRYPQNSVTVQVLGVSGKHLRRLLRQLQLDWPQKTKSSARTGIQSQPSAPILASSVESRSETEVTHWSFGVRSLLGLSTLRIIDRARVDGPTPASSAWAASCSYSLAFSRTDKTLARSRHGRPIFASPLGVASLFCSERQPQRQPPQGLGDLSSAWQVRHDHLSEAMKSSADRHSLRLPKGASPSSRSEERRCNDD